MCKKGPTCNYAHGKREIGISTRVCMFRSEYCSYMERCTLKLCGYAHTEVEKRNRIDEMDDKTFKEAKAYIKDQSSKSKTQPESAKLPMRNDTSPLDGSKPTPKPMVSEPPVRIIKGYKCEICPLWQQKKCKLGPACLKAHGQK